MRSPTHVASGMSAPRSEATPPWALRPVSLLARFRESEYLTAGRSPRFRAVQRRRTVGASRVGFIVIAGAALFDAVALYDLQPGKGPILVALNQIDRIEAALTVFRAEFRDTLFYDMNDRAR